MSKTVWIDLTDLEKWNGQHGGTQRVVYGIAKEYYLDKKVNVSFFSYSTKLNRFYLTSFKPVYDRVERSRQEHSVQPDAPSLRNKILVYAKTHVPGFVRNSSKARAACKKLYGSARDIAKASVLLGKKAKALLKNKDGSDLKPIEFGADDTVLILGKPWDSPGLQKLLIEQKSKTGFKIVQVVYDLLICLHPQLHHVDLFKPYTLHMFDAIQCSDLMLCISEHTRKDLYELCDRLNLKKPEAVVIRIGDELDINQTAVDKTNPLYEPQSFVICVGTLEIRKNHLLLYQTYKLAEEQSVELPKLVVIGGKGWLEEQFIYMVEHDPAVKGKIDIRNDINDIQLSWLYQNCLFTVYPSLYEGWGLPVAESLAYGKYCIASSAASVPEIGGKLIDYFSPNDAGACLAAYKKGMDHKYRHSKEAQLKSYKVTLWRDTYDQICKLLAH
ncbi:MAG: glycosyltransferase [Candidatus Nomurabacteria bacterium]|nr:glycosyltransferase [Candidatus Nomurabacteria bacterium]